MFWKGRMNRFRHCGMFFWAAVVAAVLSQGCAGTKLAETWTDEGFGTKPFKRVLVLGGFSEEAHRRTWEKGLVSALSDAGTRATAGFELMPGSGDYDEVEEIRAAVNRSGADAVMIARLKGVEKNEKFMPPRVEYVPSMGDRYGLYEFYGADVEPVVRPGYTITDTIVSLEAVLFDATSQQMVWRGITRTLNPESGEAVTRDAAGVIIRELKKAGLL